jgi:four helix bundle protein
VVVTESRLRLKGVDVLMCDVLMFAVGQLRSNSLMLSKVFMIQPLILFNKNVVVMSKVNRFEDLRCWQASRRLVGDIYHVAESGKLFRDFDTKGQLKRAALSIMNNIAEGFGKFSNKEFIRYLDTAQSSALEVKSILYVLSDMNYLSPEKITELHQLCDEVRFLTLALIKYLRSRERVDH